MSVDVMKSLISQKGGLARSNLFRVILPSSNLSNSEELNILCTRVSLPLKQIATRERVIGPRNLKLPYAIATDDTDMSFLVLNDYGVKKYFDSWQKMIINEDTNEVNYFRDYARDIRIDQLKNSYTKNVTSNDIQQDSLGIRSRSFLNNANDNLSSLRKDNISYSCILQDAYPTTISQIDLSNELNGLVELNVSFSYRKWKEV